MPHTPWPFEPKVGDEVEVAYAVDGDDHFDPRLSYGDHTPPVERLWLPATVEKIDDHTITVRLARSRALRALTRTDVANGILRRLEEASR